LDTNEEYRIVCVGEPGRAEWMAIGGGIGAYNEQQAGDDSSHSLCFVLRGPDEEIAGGVIGAVHYTWLYVDLMWVREDLRGQGYGHRLLTLVEEAARDLGAQHAYLDTFSFQAPGFYEKHGYQVFGELRDFPPGHTRTYLAKQL